MSRFNPLVVIQDATQGRFAIERELGRGGMGIVYLARDLALDRAVAIKMLPPLAALAVVPRERFVKEARIAASLSHPNILPIHTFEDHEACSFFVMAYVDGESLEQRVDRLGPLDVESGLKILREVAWALDHAHLRGIVHRDVKPANIMLERDSGRALVADFGIARDSRESLTAPDQAIGTQGYASPEQMRGNSSDHRTDLYGLGATGWFMFSGEHPHPPSGSGDSNRRPLAILPRRVDAALEACRSSEPSARPDNAGEVADVISAELDRTSTLPVALRDWIEAGRAFTIPLLWLTLLPFLNVGWVWRATDNPVLLFTIGLPWMFFGLYRMGRLGPLVRLGYGISDIRAGLRVWKRERNRSLSLLPRRTSPTVSRLIRQGTFLAVLTAIVGAALPRRLLQELTGLGGIGTWLLIFGSNLAFLGILIGWIWPRWAPPERDAFAELRLRFWDSHLGSLLVTLTKIPLWNRASPRRLADTRATEVALAGGVLEYLAQLDAPIRRRLADLPGTVSALEHGALELRQAIGRLEDLELSALPVAFGTLRHESTEAVAEISVRRDILQQRHRDIVESLERIRLGTMRLVARTELPDGITGSLAEAKELTELLKLLEQAQRAVDSETEAQSVP